MPAKRLAYRLFHPVLRWLRSHPAVIRRFFSVRLPKGADVAFDPTTIVLARAAAELLGPDDRTSFEMGIGAGALVSLSLAQHCQQQDRPLSIAGCDCVPRRVESARSVAGHNGLEADFFASDLFDHVNLDGAPRRFDLILFNPPYVPTGVGEELKMGERLTDERTMWDGGDDGLVVLRQFLADAPDHLTPTGRVLFGVQHVFVTDEAVVAAIDASRFELAGRYTRRLTPAEVYVLRLPPSDKPS